MLLSLVTAVKTLQLEFNFYYLLALYKVFLFPCTNSLNDRYALKYRLTLFYLLHAAVYLFSNQCYATMKFFYWMKEHIITGYVGYFIRKKTFRY